MLPVALKQYVVKLRTVLGSNLLQLMKLPVTSYFFQHVTCNCNRLLLKSNFPNTGCGRLAILLATTTKLRHFRANSIPDSIRKFDMEQDKRGYSR